MAAFLSRVGRTFRQTSTHVTAPNSMLQSIRGMSSSYVKLFVGGISYSTDEYGLEEAFSQYGQVADARVVVDRETGRSRGFAFVTFTRKQGAANARLHLDGQYLHGRRIRVKYALEGPGARYRLLRRGGYEGGLPVFYDDPLPNGDVEDYAVFTG